MSKTDLNTNRIVEEVTKSSQFDKNKPKSNQYNYQKVSFSMSLSFIVFEQKKKIISGQNRAPNIGCLLPVIDFEIDVCNL